MADGPELTPYTPQQVWPPPVPKEPEVSSTVRVRCTLDDGENFWCWEDEHADASDGYLIADVPRPLYEEMASTFRKGHELLRRLAESAGIDPETGCKVDCCPSWVGTVSKARSSVHVGIRASGDPEVWPIIDVDHVTSFPTQQDADDFIAGLPDVSFLWPAHGQLVEVDRSRFFTIPHAGWTFVSSCHRCGWDRGDHADQGVAEDA